MNYELGFQKIRTIIVIFFINRNTWNNDCEILQEQFAFFHIKYRRLLVPSES